MTETEAPGPQRSVATGGTQSAAPGAEHRALDACIGRWINSGETVATPDEPAVPILTSDVYEWAPGGFFVVHSAYGRFGDTGVGAVEMIGYDPATKSYRTHLFDSQGNIGTEELTVAGRTWLYQGETTRCTVEFSEDGTVQTAHHERSEDGGETWVPSMEVTLTKVS